ncbi:MAG: tRNA pseudouridine(38-40) synthase TruA [Bacteroidales bacterium]|jgi:tRNA pseudouridine38-40 synthase|nr:tRNA pseudouridine(38-40) synthase TruA [Bacteroidales bacterium]MDD3165992.1 tRNA pseudouridine(38-40) synthase TruA [Bacteroidales bacterium]MDD4769934.1 tRNA pseudouridine(38-40) synthase TruA [Bacteroidales bacterium]HKL92873.1 tRNA pseudouridine(38-40) synthase TruA [Bacteroidales bacterium]
MPRYFLKFSYDGTAYHGWQIQPNQVSVQESMTKVLARLFGSEVELTGAGRTDAGVHARCMFAHFDSPFALIDCMAMARKLNHMMPFDIAVHALYLVGPKAHARFDAHSRTYEYHLCASKDPFRRAYSMYMNFPLDVAAMNRAAACLFDYQDFTSFSKLHTDVKTNHCRIRQAYWAYRDGVLVFTIQADRFLRNMVRAIVGTLLLVGRGKLDEAGFRAVIEARDRCKAGGSVEAKGLFLVDVEYPYYFNTERYVVD